MPTTTPIDRMDGPTLLKTARLLATRQAAVTEAQRRLDNGSTSKFPKQVIAKYGQAPLVVVEGLPEPIPAVVHLTPEQEIERLRVIARTVARRQADLLARERMADGTATRFVPEKIRLEKAMVAYVNGLPEAKLRLVASMA